MGLQPQLVYPTRESECEEGFRIEDEAAALNALYRELLGGGGDGLPTACRHLR